MAESHEPVGSGITAARHHRLCDPSPRLWYEDLMSNLVSSSGNDDKRRVREGAGVVIRSMLETRWVFTMPHPEMEPPPPLLP